MGTGGKARRTVIVTRAFIFVNFSIRSRGEKNLWERKGRIAGGENLDEVEGGVYEERIMGKNERGNSARAAGKSLSFPLEKKEPSIKKEVTFLKPGDGGGRGLNLLQREPTLPSHSAKELVG